MTGVIIDISSNNHGGSGLDFAAAKRAGVIGVIIKATEGLGYTNPFLVPDWLDARKAGLITGSYHFARQDSNPSLQDARREAQHYINVMRTIPGHHDKVFHRGNIIPILDFEKTVNGQCSPWRDVFFDEVHRLTKHWSMLYTYTAFNRWVKPRWRQRKLWIADYANQLTLPIGYGGYHLWQNTDKFPCPGIGHTDKSILPRTPLALWNIRCHNNG